MYFVRYGDHLMLNGKEAKMFIDGKNTFSKNRLNGTISCVGGLETAVFFQERSSSKKGEDSLSKWSDAFSIESDNIFEITPKLSCKRRIKYGMIRSAEKNEKEEEKLERLKEARVQAEKDMKKEVEYNKIILKKMFGKEVHFGDKVQFLHLRSRSFLDVKKNESKLKQVTMRMFLSQDLDNSMRFVMQPRYKIHQDGTPVCFGDKVILKNVKFNSYLEVLPDPSPNIYEVIKDKTPVVNSLHPPVTLRMNSSRICNKTGCMRTISSTILWQLVDIPKTAPDPSIICANQYVYIQHAENQGYLSVMPQTSEFSNVYLRKYIGKNQIETISAQSIWQIQLVHPNIKERFSPLTTSKEKIIIRNYFTGQVLCVDDEEALTCKYFHPKESDPHSAYLQFQSLNSTCEGFIKDQESYIIIHERSNLTFLSSSKLDRGFTVDRLKENLNQRFKKAESSLEIEKNESGLFNNELHEKFFKKMTSDDKEIRVYMVDLEVKGVSLEDGFCIKRVPADEMIQIMAIESSYARILEVVESIKYKLESHLPMQSMFEANSAIDGLSAFLVDVALEDYNENKVYSPIPFRQKLMKDMKLFELLTEFVYLPFASGMYSMRRISEFPHVQKAIKSAYSLMMLIVKNYPPNETYVSQWLGLFVYQMSFTNGINCIGAQEMLTTLFNDNKRLLSLIDSGVIKRITDVLRHRIQDEIYINLVNSLIVCSEKVFELNQETVTEFLLNEGVYEQFVHMELRSSSKGEPMVSLNGIFLTLVDFYTIHEVKKDQRYNFFKETINLLSNLCRGRNFKAIMPLRKFYSSQYCLSVIEGEHIDYSLRRNFLQLFFCLYIDDQPLQEFFPHYLRFWNESNQEFACSIATPTGKEEKTEKEKQLKMFKEILLRNLDQLAEGGVIHMNEQGVNKLMLRILVLIRKLIKFGQFSQIFEIERLYIKLIDLLDGTTDTFDHFRPSKPKTRSISRESRASARFGEDLLRKIVGGNLAKKQKKKGARHSENIDGLVIGIKLEIIKTMMRLDKIQLDFSLTSFLNMFWSYGYSDDSSQSEGKSRSKPVLNVKEIKEYLGVSSRIDKETLSRQPIVWIAEILTSPHFDCLKRLPCILIDLMMYNNPRLVSAAFHLLGVQFMKSTELLDELKNVYIVEEEHLFKVLIEIDTVTRDLSRKADKCDVWIATSQSQSWVETLGKLHQVLQGSSRPKEPLTYSDSWGLPVREKVSKAYDEYYVLRDISLFSKYLIKLFIFKKGESSLVAILNYNGTNKLQSQAMTRCQLATYTTLIILISKNNSLKQSMMGLWETIFNQISSSSNTNAHLLLKAVIENTKELQEPLFVRRIIKHVIGFVDQIISKSFIRAASVLSIIEVCLKSNGLPIKHNQTSFMTIISKFPFVLFSKESPEVMRAFVKAMKRETSNLNGWLFTAHSLDHERNNYFEVSPQVSYFNQVFSLLSLACEGFNGTAESIGKKMHSLEDLLFLIEITKSLPYSKRHIWAFFYNCYLGKVAMTDGSIQRALGCMVEPFLVELQRTLESIVEIANDAMIPYKRMFIADHKSWELLESFLGDFFTNTLCAILSEMTAMSFWQTNPKNAEAFAKRVLGILDNAVKELPQPQYMGILVAIAKQMRLVCEKMPVLNDFVPEVPRKLIKSRLSSLGLGLQVSRKRENVEKIAEAFFITLDHEKKVSVGRTKLMIAFKKSLQKLEKPEVDMKVPMSSLIQKERISMISYIENIHVNSWVFLKKRVKIDKENVYESLMTVLKAAEQPKNVFYAVRLFRSIIENKAKLNYDILDSKMTIAEANYDQVGRELADLKEIQDTLVNIGLVDYLILNFIKHSQRDVREQVVLCLIAVMSGGNSHAQERVYRVLSTDKRNVFMDKLYNFTSLVAFDIKNAMKLASTKFYENYLKGISRTKGESKRENKVETRKTGKDQAKKHKENAKSKNQSLDETQSGKGVDNSGRKIHKFVTKISDNYRENLKQESGTEITPFIQESSFLDKLNERESLKKLEMEGDKLVLEDKRQSQKEMKEKESNQELVLLGCRLMKLLSCFCHGSFSDLQNHLREQAIDGELIGDKNFIILAADSFSSFVKYVNGECLDFGIGMMNFLIKSVQGPCKKNQTVCSKKVIENSMFFFTFFPQTKDLKSILTRKGICEEELVSKVIYLMNKNIGLLAGLVEGNDDPRVIRYFERTLKLKVVLEKMDQGYSKYIHNVLKVKGDINPFTIATKIKNVDFFDEATHESFNSFLLLSYMSEYSPKISKEVKSLLETASPGVIKAYKFYEMYTGRIEVVLEEDKILPYYFPMPPICDRFLELDKRSLLDSISRDTVNEKHTVPLCF